MIVKYFWKRNIFAGKKAIKYKKIDNKLKKRNTKKYKTNWKKVDNKSKKTKERWVYKKDTKLI